MSLRKMGGCPGAESSSLAVRVPASAAGDLFQKHPRQAGRAPEIWCSNIVAGARFHKSLWFMALALFKPPACGGAESALRQWCRVTQRLLGRPPARYAPWSSPDVQWPGAPNGGAPSRSLPGRGWEFTAQTPGIDQKTDEMRDHGAVGRATLRGRRQVALEACLEGGLDVISGSGDSSHRLSPNES